MEDAVHVCSAVRTPPCSPARVSVVLGSAAAVSRGGEDAWEVDEVGKVLGAAIEERERRGRLPRGGWDMDRTKAASPRWFAQPRTECVGHFSPDWPAFHQA